MKKLEIKHSAVAGTLESSDIQIMIDKGTGNGIELELQSSVINQYGDEIKAVIYDTLAALKITDLKIKAVDKGALNCTIAARTMAAVYRGADVSDYSWEEYEQWNV